MMRFKIGFVVCLAAGTGVAACATKTGKGALLGAGGGAALGAGIGALAGGGKGAALGAGLGAGIGAGAGALIGNYMDKQEAELKKVKGANVQREGDKLVVKFNSAILFDTGKTALKPASRKDLGEFANVLREYKETDVIIEGHTDNVGKKDLNTKLSVARAQSVIGFLEKQGVARDRLTGQGHGDGTPIADNATEKGRQQNRRVQVLIKANEKLKQQDAAAAQGQPPPKG